MAVRSSPAAPIAAAMPIASPTPGIKDSPTPAMAAHVRLKSSKGQRCEGLLKAGASAAALPMRRPDLLPEKAEDGRTYERGQSLLHFLLDQLAGDAVSVQAAGSNIEDNVCALPADGAETSLCSPALL